MQVLRNGTADRDDNRAVVVTWVRYAAAGAKKQLRAVIDGKPDGFGEEPDRFHNDAIFLIDIEPDEAMAVFDPREGVDRVWPGEGVISAE